MYMLLKALVLFLSLLLLVPLVFFLLLGYVGKYLSFTVDRNSWVARTNISWVRKLFKKFIA